MVGFLSLFWERAGVTISADGTLLVLTWKTLWLPVVGLLMAFMSLQLMSSSPLILLIGGIIDFRVVPPGTFCFS